jgi:catechol 2,3-dioxygenase-like lactoylglutathione lyase family enzyme
MMPTTRLSEVTLPMTDLAIPLLPSRSLERTLAFYHRLGFEGEIVSPANDYAILHRGSLEVHFFLHPTLIPTESAFGCYFRVQDAEAIFEAFSAVGLPHTGIPRITPIEDKPWGMREFALLDEDGSLLRIGQER